MTAPNTPEGVYATAVVRADYAHGRAESVLSQLRSVEPDNALLGAAHAAVVSTRANLEVQVGLFTACTGDPGLSFDGAVVRAYIVNGGHTDVVPEFTLAAVPDER